MADGVLQEETRGSSFSHYILIFLDFLPSLVTRTVTLSLNLNESMFTL